MSPLRIVEWSQSVYADMPQKCWTITTDTGYEVAGTFWERETAEQALQNMLTYGEKMAAGLERSYQAVVDAHFDELRRRDEEAIRGADPTVRHPEGY